MFKWACLGVATVFLSLALWMLNDVRLQVRRSADVVHEAAATINQDLPPIVERSRQTTQVVSTNLPKIVERVNKATETMSETLPEVMQRVDTTTEVVAELAEDVRRLKQLLAGPGKQVRDDTLVAYANSVLDLIEKSGGVIGVKKFGGKTLKNPVPAAEWVVVERKEAFVMTLLAKSKKDMLNAIVKTKFRSDWYIQLPGKEPVKLLDWLKENHGETKALI